MANLYDVYQFVCIRIVDRRKGGKRPLMKENEFFSAVFTDELKFNYPALLNHRHHRFDSKAFQTLAEKKRNSQMHRQSLLLYFMNHPSAINALCASCQKFLSEHISIINRNLYEDGIRKWRRQLHLKPDEPLLKNLTPSDRILDSSGIYSRQMTWMLLDALCTAPSDLCLLFSRYSQESQAFSAAADCLQFTTHLQELCSHAVNTLTVKDKNEKQALYFNLAQEFSRLRILYQQNQSLYPANCQSLFVESLYDFEHFLLDLEQKSAFPHLNLQLMQKNIEKLKALCCDHSL